jgi:hypothetical protein
VSTSWAVLRAGLSGAIQEAARREAVILRFLLVADAYGVDEITARGIVDNIRMEAQRSPQPFRIEAAYLRLWQSVRPLNPPARNVMAAPYNAVGDGVADDTAAIQGAIDYPGARQHLLNEAGVRHHGESRIDATERVLSSYSYGADTATFDSRPEHCWRCDARGAETDVGLCTSCHDDLRE